MLRNVHNTTFYAPRQSWLAVCVLVHGLLVFLFAQCSFHHTSGKWHNKWGSPTCNSCRHSVSVPFRILVLICHPPLYTRMSHIVNPRTSLPFSFHWKKSGPLWAVSSSLVLVFCCLWCEYLLPILSCFPIVAVLERNVSWFPKYYGCSGCEWWRNEFSLYLPHFSIWDFAVLWSVSA